MYNNLFFSPFCILSYHYPARIKMSKVFLDTSSNVLIVDSFFFMISRYFRYYYLYVSLVSYLTICKLDLVRRGYVLLLDLCSVTARANRTESIVFPGFCIACTNIQ